MNACNLIYVIITETSSTYAQYQRTGIKTAPASTLPHFKVYTVDDFHFLTVLGTGGFGKVCRVLFRLVFNKF